MRTAFLLLVANLSTTATSAQQHVLDSFMVGTDVKICIDKPSDFSVSKNTILIIFALPNGNSIAHTMGKQMKSGDDWHYDIQHIKAQTTFIRQQLKKENIVVVYAANNFNSWPLWKQKHSSYTSSIKHIIDTISSLFQESKTIIYLNGHSGGGSFIFGYLQGLDVIPDRIERISFIDSNYGYDSTYNEKITKWLKQSKNHYLTVFAYNDSVALYNEKPVVSLTGGTWYRSHLMLRHFEKEFIFNKKLNDSLIVYKSKNERIQFLFKTNPGRKIYHTQQVELNGFIHSVLCGTRYDSKDYYYYGKRAYSSYIEE